ncbi:hypothetical protein [Altericroceibacterium endophyticum]|uniref:Uncharacterized protein n=1 Tax=Altericroceibacterium endophyticum TaxID=1808508 RepID=A0A6I4TAS9_9SPHN|nr:hypothetical protein [Altericroceibacterium endophyticum]MXO66865.1 hypothetical protein [Altericroceibacterium endophyticum]
MSFRNYLIWQWRRPPARRFRKERRVVSTLLYAAVFAALILLMATIDPAQLGFSSRTTMISTAAAIVALGAIILLWRAIRRIVTGAPPQRGKPYLAPRPQPVFDMGLADLGEYLQQRASWRRSLQSLDDDARLERVSAEISRMVPARNLRASGLWPDGQRRPIHPFFDWPMAKLNLDELTLTLGASAAGVKPIVITDIFFSGAEVRRAWPAPFWRP